MEKIITRFAPSPTGMLHIGGARTALFNYLFAKKNNGKFLLRIEDTDLERSTEKSKQAIIDGLNWLQLQWDGEIVYQITNTEKHKAAALSMIENGSAYYAYDNMEELAKLREEAQLEGKIYRYNPIWRDENLPTPKDIKPTIRLKVPAGKTIIQDIIHGAIEFNNEDLEDLVLLRSDGFATYMLAVVADDIEMNITHIIRGDDHISNTPKQAIIYQALGASVPKFAHLPLLHDIEGKKLSKRKNAVAVSDYQNLGYLPEAICSYLMQLGWSAQTEKPYLTMGEAIELFSLERVGKSPSRFDFDKLNHINSCYIQNMSDRQLFEKVSEELSRLRGYILSNNDKEIIQRGIEEMKKQSTIVEIIDWIWNFLPDSEHQTSDQAKNIISENAEIVCKLKTFIQTADFNNFSTDFNLFLKSHGYKFPQVGPLIRAMLIGKTDSTAISTIVNILGKEESILRVLAV